MLLNHSAFIHTYSPQTENLHSVANLTLLGLESVYTTVIGSNSFHNALIMDANDLNTQANDRV